jgi:hypothetical protein
VKDGKTVEISSEKLLNLPCRPALFYQAAVNETDFLLIIMTGGFGKKPKFSTFRKELSHAPD